MKFNKALVVRSLSAVAVVATVAVSSAQAALDPAVSDAFTTVTSSATDILPVMYTAMAAITGGFVVFGLVKKGIRKVA